MKDQRIKSGLFILNEEQALGAFQNNNDPDLMVLDTVYVKVSSPDSDEVDILPIDVFGKDMAEFHMHPGKEEELMCSGGLDINIQGTYVTTDGNCNLLSCLAPRCFITMHIDVFGCINDARMSVKMKGDVQWVLKTFDDQVPPTDVYNHTSNLKFELMSFSLSVPVTKRELKMPVNLCVLCEDPMNCINETDVNANLTVYWCKKCGIVHTVPDNDEKHQLLIPKVVKKKE